MKLKNYLLSWDFLSSIIIGLLVFYAFDQDVKNDFSQSIYNVGISVLAIVFSVYFAALAILISSSDNDFVKYLEKQGYFSRLLTSFRSSLLALLIALIYSILVYAMTSYWISNHVGTQNKSFLAFFTGAFLYSLFSTVASSLDAIRYAEFRVRFLLKKEGPVIEDIVHENDNSLKRRA